ncbi:outer membrane protein transport protein [Methylocystis sp. 9N]|uniref:Outer membrane protein transport protein n=1 Tax=Methylocystis borbori TaxID=3118750 RepID=A0ABU7XFF3_9HYPH
MSKMTWRHLLLLLTTLGLLAPGSSFGADGYFLIGYGPRQKALAGAGAADQRDAMALSVNPAGIVGLERQFQLGLTAINGDRGYRTTGFPRVLAPGEVRSGRPWFAVPNSGYVQPIDAVSAWSLSSYANGGINTSYDWGHYHPPLGGPLGGGFAGIDLQQGFLSIGYARRFGTPLGPLTIGVAPTIAIQMINIQGLRPFSSYSANPWEMSDMAYDWSYGGGLRAGALWGVADNFRLGLSASTPMWMSRFEKYSGLIADYGRFDIPAQLQAGLAYDILPNLTVMLDWRHIFFSAVPVLGNPTNPLLPRSLGSKDGPGFDWTDVDSGAIGAEWRYSPTLALRAGYHYASNPLRWRSVTVNVLSPIINRHQASIGFNYAVTRNSAVDFAFVYAFKNSVTGVEWLPAQPGLPFGGPNPFATITPWVDAFEITLGYNYKWDAGDNSWLPTRF